MIRSFLCVVDLANVFVGRGEAPVGSDGCCVKSSRQPAALAVELSLPRQGGVFWKLDAVIQVTVIAMTLNR